MNKTILGAAALAMTLALGAAPIQASAKDRYPTATDLDTDKDGMVSREEYLAMAGKRYDEAMAKMMKMGAADQAKMVKDHKMTFAGYEAFIKTQGGH